MPLRGPCCGTTPTGSCASAWRSSGPTTPPGCWTSNTTCCSRPGERVGGQLDYFQWTTLLREVSALTAYRWVYRESVRPWLVADLLVLNRQMPRSLASCQGMIVSYLDRLATDYGRRGPAQRIASARLTRFNETSIEQIFQSGLHEYILGFLSENNGLAAAIHDQYLV